MTNPPREPLQDIPAPFSPTSEFFDAEVDRMIRGLERERKRVDEMVEKFKAHVDSLENFNDGLHQIKNGLAIDHEYIDGALECASEHLHDLAVTVRCFEAHRNGGV